MPDAAGAGEVVLCEGYTDVIAMHQAGLRNAVGLMGTALTTEQLGELFRMSSTVLLALDADGAGQEAMLRGARLAARRQISLRVVELPGGADPAELIQREGPDAMRTAIARSVAVERFRVERLLERGDPPPPRAATGSSSSFAPCSQTLPRSEMWMELVRLVSDRLDLPESVAEGLLPSASHAPHPGSFRLPRRARAPRGKRRTRRSRPPRPAHSRNAARRPSEPSSHSASLCPHAEPRRCRRSISPSTSPMSSPAGPPCSCGTELSLSPSATWTSATRRSCGCFPS